MRNLPRSLMLMGMGVLLANAQAQVQVVKQHDVVPNVQAFPRVVAGPGVAATQAAKINAALTRLDKDAASAARECHAMLKDEHKDPDPEAWTRSVEVLMTGPRFLSLLATDNYYCGGAHPDGGDLPLVYDLTLGRPVDWLTLLPAGAKAVLSSAADGSRLGVVEWPALQELAASKAENDCQESFTDRTVHFALWLDGSAGVLKAKPSNFAHVETSCAEPVELGLDELRKLGFARVLTDALAAAKRSAK